MNKILFLIIFFISPVFAAPQKSPLQLTPLFVQTVKVSGTQGITFYEGKIYVFGDAKPGVVQEFQFDKEALLPLSTAWTLTIKGQNEIPHPTGLALHPKYGTFLGNTVQGKGTIFHLDWNKLKAEGNADHAILHRTVDDAAVNGTRPEFVEVDGKVLLATADYGPSGNEVRLYNPEKVALVSKTTDPGVVVARFSCSPWVQSLHWYAPLGWLILVQNQIEGLKWRLSVLDLKKSVAEKKSHVVQIIDLPPEDEFEGFVFVPESSKANEVFGIGVSSSPTDNVRVYRINIH
jgi:hypothetical protein